MYKIHYRIWANDGKVCCEGEEYMFSDAFNRVQAWLAYHAIYAEIARIEFERIDNEPLQISE